MCACEPGFTCSRCQGTTFDPQYLWLEQDVTEETFAELVDEPRYPIAMLEPVDG
jgi:hypothetical protein